MSLYQGNTHRIKVGCGTLYVTLAKGDDGPLTHIRLGKGGTCASSQCEALGRLLSTALKYNAPMDELISQLSGINCSVPTTDVKSCADGIAQILKREEERK